MKSKSAKRVPLPDINALADKQQAAQKQNILEALTANRANQVNQFGSIDWNRDPTTGEWTQTESYNPQQQGLLDQQVRTQGILGQQGEQLAGGIDYDYSGAPAAPTPGGYVAEATDALRKLQEPELARREASQRQRLASMGVQGNERVVATTDQNMADARDRADLQAIMQGYERGDTMFGQGMTARNTYTGEQDRQIRNLGGMMQGAAPEDLQFGGYAKQGTVDAPDYTGNALKMHGLAQEQENARAAAKNQKGNFINSLIKTGVGAAANYFLPGSGAVLGGMMGGYGDKAGVDAGVPRY